jgi:hypothetical protein
MWPRRPEDERPHLVLAWVTILAAFWAILAALLWG